MNSRVAASLIARRVCCFFRCLSPAATGLSYAHCLGYPNVGVTRRSWCGGRGRDGPCPTASKECASCAPIRVRKPKRSLPTSPTARTGGEPTLCGHGSSTKECLWQRHAMLRPARKHRLCYGLAPMANLGDRRITLRPLREVADTAGVAACRPRSRRSSAPNVTNSRVAFGGCSVRHVRGPERCDRGVGRRILLG